jgi:hypothetical protein
MVEKKFLKLGVASLAVVALVIGLSVGLTQKNRNNKVSSSNYATGYSAYDCESSSVTVSGSKSSKESSGVSSSKGSKESTSGVSSGKAGKESTAGVESTSKGWSAPAGRHRRRQLNDASWGGSTTEAGNVAEAPEGSASKGTSKGGSSTTSSTKGGNSKISSTKSGKESGVSSSKGDKSGVSSSKGGKESGVSSSKAEKVSFVETPRAIHNKSLFVRCSIIQHHFLLVISIFILFLKWTRHHQHSHITLSLSVMACWSNK